MVPVAQLIAHGGLAGALVEVLIVVAIALVFLAVWLRERRARGALDTGDECPAAEATADESSSTHG